MVEKQLLAHLAEKAKHEAALKEKEALMETLVVGYKDLAEHAESNGSPVPESEVEEYRSRRKKLARAIINLRCLIEGSGTAVNEAKTELRSGSAAVLHESRKTFAAAAEMAIMAKRATIRARTETLPGTARSLSPVRAVSPRQALSPARRDPVKGGS